MPSFWRIFSDASQSNRAEPRRGTTESPNFIVNRSEFVYTRDWIALYKSVIIILLVEPTMWVCPTKLVCPSGTFAYLDTCHNWYCNCDNIERIQRLKSALQLNFKLTFATQSPPPFRSPPQFHTLRSRAPITELLAGAAATSIIQFVATKTKLCLSRDKVLSRQAYNWRELPQVSIFFVVTKVLSRQTRVCHDKQYDWKHVFRVATKVCLSRQKYCLSRQKWYLWQLLPMIQVYFCRDKRRVLSRQIATNVLSLKKYIKKMKKRQRERENVAAKV